MSWVERLPAPFHPLLPATDDDPEPRPDTSRVVEVHQLRPDLVDALVEWCEGTQLTLNGGAVVLLPGRGSSATRLVGLGDYAVRDGATYRAEPAAGFAQRYTPAEPG